MKKLLLTTLLAFCLHSFAYAGLIVVDYQGETIVHQQSVERNLLINSNDDGNYNIAIKPIDDALRSIDGAVEIPLENLYINNTREDVFLRYNEYSIIYDALAMNGVAKNMTAKIRDFGMVPAGTYSINFEIQATDVETQTIEATSTFNLQFIIPTVQEISLHYEVPKIVVGAADAFSKDKKIPSETSPMVYINSNCDWELLVNADEFGEGAGNYYIRTVSASSNVEERLQEKVLLQYGKEITLAKGKAPANNEYVSVEFSLENADGKIFKAGSYNNRIKYILKEVR